MKTIYALRSESAPIGWAFFTNLQKAVQAAGFGEKKDYQAVYRRMRGADWIEFQGRTFVRLELN